MHGIFSVGPASFGLGAVALNLCRAQREQKCSSEVWCLDSVEDVKWAALTSGLSLERIRRFPCIGSKALGYSLSMERLATGAIGREFDIVHQHCIWSGVFRTTRTLHQKYNVPYIIAPHGSLEPWALSRYRWGKKLALFFYEAKNLRNAACLHALSKQEMAGFREFGLRTPIAVIQNGISQSWLASEGDAEDFRRSFDIMPGKRILLYLSRITPVKGILLLVEAMAAVRKDLDNWILVLAGMGDSGHLAEIRAAIKKYHLENHVVFTGMLINQAKRDAFAAADLFVLPTKREAAPVVVLEALGAGLPVLTTKGAPWEDLVSHHSGWWVDVDAGAIAEALHDALSQSTEQLLLMGQRGKELVASKYTWAKSAQMTIELYEWLLGRRERPDFVVI